MIPVYWDLDLLIIYCYFRSCACLREDRDVPADRVEAAYTEIPVKRGKYLSI